MPRFTLQYSARTLFRARKLRRTMSNMERACWGDLRGDKLGVRFRRQVPFGPYILDFFCIEAKLAVELDGPEHHTPEGEAHDARRDAYLRDRGVLVLRYDNARVQRQWDDVLAEIRSAVEKRIVR